MDGYQVRRVRADEWEQVKQLRLEALQDPIAHLAFLETYDQALARSDEEWRERIARGSAGETAGQFVAVNDGGLVGNLVVLIVPAGEKAYTGETADRTRALMVGVYVSPQHRGRGLFEELAAAAVDWLAQRGIGEVALHVHEDNTPAQAAYRKCGFSDTGVRMDFGAGVEIEMVHRIE